MQANAVCTAVDDRSPTVDRTRCLALYTARWSIRREAPSRGSHRRKLILVYTSSAKIPAATAGKTSIGLVNNAHIISSLVWSIKVSETSEIDVSF